MIIDKLSLLTLLLTGLAYNLWSAGLLGPFNSIITAVSQLRLIPPVLKPMGWENHKICVKANTFINFDSKILDQYELYHKNTL